MPVTRKELFVVDPNEFVARRDELARELRVRGDKTEAAAVKKLRRPSVALWALNVVATDRVDVAQRLLGTADAARAAQRALLEGADADGFRNALTERREAIAQVLGVAGDVIACSARSRETSTRDVEDALNAIVTSPESCVLFGDAELTTLSAGATDTTDLFAGMPALAGADTVRVRPPVPTPGPPAAPRVEPAPATDSRPSPRRVEARAAVERDRHDLEHADRELADAGVALAKAERQLVAAQREADRAIEGRARATEQLAGAAEQHAGAVKNRARRREHLARTRDLEARLE